MEYREFRAEKVGVNDTGKLHGVAVPFGRETTIGDLDHGGWREEVAPGATKKSIKDGDVVFLAHHDMHQPLARMSAGNLELREEADKLRWEADPVDTSYGRDIRALAKAKVLGGVSIGFQPVKDEWRDDSGNVSDKYNGTHRVLREIRLIEISAVTNPAYKDTSIMARDELLAERESRAQETPEERAAKPYGNVPYADPKNGKYPIDKPHVKAAWAYINQAKNAAKYPLNGVSLASVKARIKKAMKKFGFTSGSAGESKNFEFANPEWRDDDPYLDDWYELDDIDDDGASGEAKSQDDGPYANLVSEILARRSVPAVAEMIDYCITLRDDPDGKEYDAIDTALRSLRKAPPDHKGALRVLMANRDSRDDPDGREYAAIDQSIRHLQETPPDVKSAKMCLAENQMFRRDQDQEPETSTPDLDADEALRMKMRSRELEIELESTSNEESGGVQ